MQRQTAYHRPFTASYAASERKYIGKLDDKAANMTISTALTLAQTAGRAESDRVQLANKFLGNARNRAALANRILTNASAEHRALYERFYGNALTDGWDLLLGIAARKDVT